MLQVKMALDLAYESGVKVVAGAMRDDRPDDRSTKQIEVSQQVEDLMANQLVPEAEIAVEYSSLADHDRIIKRPAQTQVATVKLFDIFEEAVGSARRNLFGKFLSGDVEGDRLFSEDRMVEAHGIDDLKALRRTI